MAKDKVHEAVRNALQKDGWSITHDPYQLKVLDVEYEKKAISRFNLRLVLVDLQTETIVEWKA